MFCNFVNKVSVSYFILLVLSFYNLSAEAKLISEGNRISVLPNTCVSLHKDRKCFAKTIITWHAERVGKYCIAIKANVTHKKCWKDVRQGEFIYEMASKESVVITLFSSSEDLILAKTAIEVSWLYTGDSRKRRWRLF